MNFRFDEVVGVLYRTSEEAEVAFLTFKIRADWVHRWHTGHDGKRFIVKPKCASGGLACVGIFKIGFSIAQIASCIPETIINDMQKHKLSNNFHEYLEGRV
jgi:hypothetical protein